MAYPHIYLRRRARRLIMITLIMSFFVLVPTIIGYTIGYRYDWQKRRLEQTGVISINIEPRDASISLNNVKILKRSPLRLPNRAPGTYHLIIEKSGYHAWEKDITVTSKQTTFIKNISLFRRAKPALVAFRGQTIENMSGSVEGDYLLLGESGPSEYSTSLFETKTNTRTVVALDPLSTTSTAEWSPFAPFFSITKATGSTLTVDLFSATDLSLHKTHTVAKTASVTRSQWQKNTGVPVLYGEIDGIVYRFSTTEQIEIATLPPNILWYVDDSGLFWQYDAASRRLFTDAPTPRVIAITSAYPLQDIIDLNEARLIAKTGQGIYVQSLGSDQGDPAILPTAQTMYHQAQDEWLTWSPWELWSIYQNGFVSLLNRTSNTINEVRPLDRFGVLLLSTNTSLIGFNPGYYTTHTLWEGEEVRDIAVEPLTKKIYFTGTVSGVRGLFELPY